MLLRLSFLLFLPLTALVGSDQDGMAWIEGGTYVRPLERDGQARTVKGFYLDQKPVSNGEFLKFVTANPSWQRSRINRLFADQSYLSHWSGDLALGPDAPESAPVTNVSWFAARAYLKAQGKRLPTIDEWEFAARADEKRVDATADPEFKKRILEWYAKPNPKRLPSPTTLPADIHGVHALHGLVWEWTLDFNSALGTGESRSDGSPGSNLFCGGAGLNRNNSTEYADFMRFAMRSSLKGNYCVANLGFRGARDTK